ncbi:hypothetical protein PIB30_074582 [Stylosanthes scabra]|uniref:Uncharacterized protein n=1 Tax=Stylosanthes scabra TaxID=79078 RepID=A0ABU6VNR6_9FABA|nr:hypothetical protein [Stylosanthes scabra]
MGSRVVFYEYGKSKDYDDKDMEANAELGTIKIRHYYLEIHHFIIPFTTEDSTSIVRAYDSSILNASRLALLLVLLKLDSLLFRIHFIPLSEGGMCVEENEMEKDSRGGSYVKNEGLRKKEDE